MSHEVDRPELDLGVSREKLQSIVERQVEVPEDVLFSSIQDVLVSRAGERWREIDELWLSTQAGIRVAVGYGGPTADELWESGWIEIHQPDRTQRNYEIRKWREGDNDVYELAEVDLETDIRNPVSNFGNLAPARLLSILADAHLNTRLEELDEGAFARG